MEKRDIIAKIISENIFLKELTYSVSYKKVIDSFETGQRNYLGISLKNQNGTREIDFGFFEFNSLGNESNQMSISIRCLDCKDVKFNIFSIEQYNLVNNGSFDIKEFSLNNYPELSLEDKIQAVVKYFETVFSKDEFRNMLMGESWLDGYYYYTR